MAPTFSWARDTDAVSRPRLLWSTLGLVALAVATALVAVGAMRATAPLPAPTPTPSALTGPASVEASPTPTSSPSDARVQLVEPPLALADARTAFRGSVGACDGQATLERSLDGGRTWRTLDTPVRQLLSLSALPPSSVDLVGAGPAAGGRCRASFWASQDAGRTWDGPLSASGAWLRDPDRPRMIRTPSGPAASPCPNPNLAVVELAGLSITDAAALCPKGQVLRTLDGGASWVSMSVVPGAVALAWESRDLGWLLDASDAQCPSFRLLQTVDGGRTWRTGGCVGQFPGASQAVTPSLAFADGEVGMAVVGDQVFVTDDSGYGWRWVS
jgi:photosystem II stability/assembly factor-like uncharacterized protein